MRWSRQVPGWLVRRRYFQRFGPLLIPRRQDAGGPQAEPLPESLPSNVLRFPGPAVGVRRPEPVRRDQESA